MIIAEWFVVGIVALATLIIAWGALGLFAALPMAIAIGFAVWLLWRHIKASQPLIVGAAAVFLLWAVAGPMVTHMFPETANSIAQQKVLTDLQAGQLIVVPNIGTKKEVFDLVQLLDNSQANRANSILQEFWSQHRHGFTASDILRLQAQLEPIMGSVNAAHEMASVMINNGPTPSLGQRVNGFSVEFEGLLTWPKVILPMGFILLVFWTIGALIKKPQFQRAGVGAFLIVVAISWAFAFVSLGTVGTVSGAQTSGVAGDQYSLTLPTGGGWSKEFDPNSVVPQGWYYMVKAPTATKAQWENGSTSSYWDLSQKAWQPFRLSNANGGYAVIVWQPTPFTGQ